MEENYSKDSLELDNNEESSEDRKKLISPSALIILVSAYIFWIVQEIFRGILTGEVEGSHKLLLGVAGTVLLVADLVLFFLVWKKHRQ